jgi:prolyl-tRNA synthetase
MGGSQSHEFMVKAEAGEDWVATCNACDYAANTERATSRLAAITDEDPAGPQPVKVSTPGQKTIEEISKFLGVPGSGQIKTLIHMVESEPVLILMRGDHQLNEAKLECALGTTVFRPALPEEIRLAMGADAGSLGPVGVKGLRIIADNALRGRKNMTTGANEDDYHIQGVTPGVHFQAEYFDLRTVQDGEGCPECDGTLSVTKAIEIGHIFKLGTKYSEALNARVLDQEGNLHPVIMGSYGIGVERILSSAAELYHDEHGMILPVSIAPFEVIVVPVSVKDPDLLQAAEDMYARFREQGVDVLLDDRDERAGVKFNDADLIGVPFRVTLGQKKLKDGIVELTVRRTGERTDVPLADAVGKVAQLIANGRRSLDDRADAIELLEGRC